MSNNIKNKNLKEKPSEIKELERLFNIELHQSRNPTKGYSQCIFKLNKHRQVVELRIVEANLTTIEPLVMFKNLEIVLLAKNSIEDISTLATIPTIRYLYIGGNKIKKIDSLTKLNRLKELAIWENPIEDPTPIASMSNLAQLYCQSTGISNINFVTGLKDLVTIAADKNNVADFSFVYSLPKLIDLSLSENMIQDISQLPAINKRLRINLSSNRISQIPSKVAEQFDWNLLLTLYYRQAVDHPGLALHVADNPLQFPPRSVINLGIEGIKDYYKNSDSFGFAPLSEGRILVIGDGSAGKSSLIERMLCNTFEQGKCQTNGIKIEHWTIRHFDGRQLMVHIWDFGGQEIQHAVHKFFFTSGCLYILVLDNRKEEEPEYWLQQVESLGGRAPVMIVFNKADDNVTEVADRKYLVEKYPNICGFFNVSCKTGFGVDQFISSLKSQVIQLSTIDEQFPNNWFKIKKSMEAKTTNQNYLEYNEYKQISSENSVLSENTQTLLLQYLTIIGAVTWFGDTYLNFLHVLSPAWITQGVYKIITSKKTLSSLGKINIKDFDDLLHPLNADDYSYDQNHYGYILSMMKKFDLCYTPDDKEILIPSAFEKMPKVEYSEFRGEEVRTYFLQFKDYMPLAVIHRFTAKKLPFAFQNNYWYSGIVIKDSKSTSLAMVQADKEAKRIYVRIKGESKLGLWEHIRRELGEITSTYASVLYGEFVLLDEKTESTVSYQDLMSYLKANKAIYFHPNLQKDYNVGYLIGLFERKESTLKRLETERPNSVDETIRPEGSNAISQLVINILNNNSSNINSQISNEINIDIDIDIKHVNQLSTELKGDANYLLGELKAKDKEIKEALMRLIEFANDAKSAKNSSEVKEKGWGRKLKNVISTLSKAGEKLKHIQDGTDTLTSLYNGIAHLSSTFHLKDIVDSIAALLHSFP